MLPHSLTNFQIQKDQTSLNLKEFIQEIIHQKNDGAHVINLDEHKSIKTHWIALHVNGDNIL